MWYAGLFVGRYRAALSSVTLRVVVYVVLRAIVPQIIILFIISPSVCLSALVLRSFCVRFVRFRSFLCVCARCKVVCVIAQCFSVCVIVCSCVLGCARCMCAASSRGGGLRDHLWGPENTVEHRQRQPPFTLPHPCFTALPVNFAVVIVVMSTKPKRGGITSGIRLPCISPAFEEQIV